MDLYQNIAKIMKREICDSEETYRGFCQRLEQGNLTRDENILTHFGTFFLPFNPIDEAREIVTAPTNITALKMLC